MSNCITVAASPHPFQDAASFLTFNQGLSVRQIIERVSGNYLEISTVHFFVNGDLIDRDDWEKVYPDLDDVCALNVVPKGGGGGGKKSPLRTVLTLAATLAAPIAGPAIGAALGFTGTIAGVSVATAVGSAVFSVASNALINAIAPAPKPKLSSFGGFAERDSETLFIEGARNELRPHRPVPLPLGRMRYVPPLGAKSFTESEGEVQFARQLFLWGKGDIHVSALKIGDTDLTNFDSYELETNDFDKDIAPVLSLYSQDVNQTDLSILVTQEAEWVTQTTSIGIDEIMVDLTFPRGLVKYNDGGSKIIQEVNVVVEVSETGTDIWTQIEDKTYSRKTDAAIRDTVRYVVPSRGQYDVRVKRITADSDDAQVLDELYFTALRSLTYQQPVNDKGVVTTALRIQATDQLSGVVDRLSGIVETHCLDWDKDTSQWVYRFSNNPASLFRYVAQHFENQAALSDLDLDLTALEYWHEKCDDRGFTFNAVYDFDVSVFEVLQDIAAAGRGQIDIIDSKWTVVMDEQKTLISQVITPRNSNNFEVSVDYPDLPHAVRAQFLNEDIGYQQDYITVYEDGYSEVNATDYQTVPLWGMTNAAQVFTITRELMREQRYRNATYTVEMDFEHAPVHRGSLVLLQHEVLNLGAQSARIQSVTVSNDMVVSLTLDDVVTIESGVSYGLQIRQPDGGVVTKSVTYSEGETKTLDFIVPFLAVEGGKDVLSPDDLVAFGRLGQETLRALVKDKRHNPRGNGVLLVMKPEAPEIFYTATPPTYEAVRSFPPEYERPNAPVIKQAQTGENVLIRNADGSVTSRAVFTLENNNIGAIGVSVKMRASGESEFREADVVYSSPTKVILEGLEDGERYDYKFYYSRNPSGGAYETNLVSEAAVLNSSKFEGQTGRPDDITGFRLIMLSDQVQLSWNVCSNIDFSHYEVRFTPNFEGTDLWSTSTPIFPRELKQTQITLPFQKGTYLIKAFDLQGNESANPALVQTIQSGGLPQNVVEVLEENPSFAGVKVNCIKQDDALIMDDPASGSAVYEFANDLDLGGVYVCRLSALIEAYGRNLSNVMSGWSSLASLVSLAGANRTQFSAVIQVQTTSDDPASANANWSDWEDLLVGDYEFRALRGRLLLESFDPNVTAHVDALSLTVDMPDRIENERSVSVPSSGLQIVYSTPFRVPPSVNVTPRVINQGDEMQITSETENGFTIGFTNGGSGVAKTIDWIAKGYGRKDS